MLVNIFVSLGTLSLYIISILKLAIFKLLFCLYQGFTVNLLLVLLSYVRIYRYFKAYNIGLIEKYQSIYLKEDIIKIHQTIKEVKLFFCYIATVLIVQTGFFIWAAIYVAKKDEI